MAIPRGNASIICGASYHVWDLPSVIICDDVAKDPSDRLSPLTSAKSYLSESRYLARYFPANIPWPMTASAAAVDNTNAAACKYTNSSTGNYSDIAASAVDYADAAAFDNKDLFNNSDTDIDNEELFYNGDTNKEMTEGTTVPGTQLNYHSGPNEHTRL